VRRELATHPREIENQGDAPDLMIFRNHGFQVERIEQMALLTLAPTHHRFTPPMFAGTDGITLRPDPQVTSATKSAKSGLEQMQHCLQD
jgi:hypothetical protein